MILNDERHAPFPWWIDAEGENIPGVWEAPALTGAEAHSLWVERLPCFHGGRYDWTEIACMREQAWAQREELA